MITLVQQRGRLPEALAASVRALADEARAHDGVEALGEQTLLDLGAGTDVGHVLAVAPLAPGKPDAPGEPGAPDQPDPPGTLVGYAQVSRAPAEGPATAELVVVPRHRRAGTGRALLDAVRGLGPVAVWAHGDLPGARALASRAGMRPVRDLWRMRRALAPADAHAPLPPLPGGVVVRPFVAGADEDALLAVNARAFAWHPEQGALDRAGLAAREAEAWFRADDVLLAERDGTLLGFTWMKVEPGSDEGELYVLGIDPAAQGQGLGRALTALTVAHLAARGARAMVLFTEGDNEAAVRTYRAAGLERDRADTLYA